MQLPEFGRVSGDWSDRPVAIVASGPSLRGFDPSRLTGCRILAVKERCFDIPGADLGFGLDLPWMARRKAALAECAVPLVLAAPKDEHLHIERPAARDGLTFVERLRKDGLSDDPDAIHSGGSSGYGAVNLAYLLGAKRVVLFGFDYGTAPGLHHYDNAKHYWHMGAHWQQWAARFDQMLPQLKAAGVEVLNACPESRVTAFPKVTIDEALQYLDRLGQPGSGGVCRVPQEHVAAHDHTNSSLRACAA